MLKNSHIGTCELVSDSDPNFGFYIAEMYRHPLLRCGSKSTELSLVLLNNR